MSSQLLSALPQPLRKAPARWREATSPPHCHQAGTVVPLWHVGTGTWGPALAHVQLRGLGLPRSSAAPPESHGTRGAARRRRRCPFSCCSHRWPPSAPSFGILAPPEPARGLGGKGGGALPLSANPPEEAQGTSPCARKRWPRSQLGKLRQGTRRNPTQSSWQHPPARATPPVPSLCTKDTPEAPWNKPGFLAASSWHRGISCSAPPRLGCAGSPPSLRPSQLSQLSTETSSG